MSGVNMRCLRVHCGGSLPGISKINWELSFENLHQPQFVKQTYQYHTMDISPIIVHINQQRFVIRMVIKRNISYYIFNPDFAVERI